MPLYEYEDRDTGGVVTLERSVDERDKVPSKLKRRNFPSSFRLVNCGSEQAYHPAAMDGRNILKGYHALEQKLGSKFRPRHKAWPLYTSEAAAEKRGCEYGGYRYI